MGDRGDRDEGSTGSPGESRGTWNHALIDLLVGSAGRALIVADASRRDLPVVSANVEAGGGGVTSDASLTQWLGRSAEAIAKALDRGDVTGQTGVWNWRVATVDGERWLVCSEIGGVQDGLNREGARGSGARDQAVIAAYEAALAVASELTLEAVLQRIVDLARQIVPARYAALGVANEQGEIVQFITSGISAEQRAAIGPLPKGHGLLGELIRKGAPLLIPNIEDDPRSVGFPPNHPEMHSLLGAPILLGTRTLGNLYLTERANGGSFTEGDLALVQLLAAHAAAAIDRARLYRSAEESRSRAEEQRDHLRIILDNLPTGVLIQAPDGTIELANSAAVAMLLGPTHPTGALPLYGRDYRILRADGTPLPNDQRPGLRAAQGEMVRNQQLVLERWDGRRIPILAQAAPLRDAAGTVTRAVVAIQDITRLREAEQLKDDFLSLISHEFRTPLTAIHGGAHLLSSQGEALDAATRGELLDDIVAESGRLDRMLANMLSLTAIMAGRLTASTEPILVDSLARKVATEVAARAPRHAFVVDAPPDLPAAEGDSALLAQVLRNLYENAVKYAPAGGEVRTTATSDGETIVISVTDQGSGIAVDQVDRVFERFHRAGADPTIRGMGLGLYLSRHLVEAQGGSIAASSPGPGLGATFSVTLPVARGWAEEDEG